ncbi:hypothetical protein TNCV_500431, partial [Trichonephila clavipes]
TRAATPITTIWRGEREVLPELPCAWSWEMQVDVSYVPRRVYLLTRMADLFGGFNPTGSSPSMYRCDVNIHSFTVDVHRFLVTLRQHLTDVPDNF